jgi:NAD(P)-dependent dehydrogenase (short-subunit alcohol dehydrogenase family)
LTEIKEMDFTDQVAIVTGGASGLGTRLRARRWRGARVSIVDLAKL